MQNTSLEPAATGFRTTRLSIFSVGPDIVETHWQLEGPDGKFNLRSTIFSANSPNVISASLDFLDIWLPPFTTFSVRARHRTGSKDKTGAVWGAWSEKTTFITPAPMNSYDRGRALSDLLDPRHIVIVE